MRKAKIICTIGPASSDERTLLRLIECGMDVARLNFSHGTHEAHSEAIRIIREAGRKTGRRISILQDLQGVKIRTGLIRNGEAELKKGSEVRIFPGDGAGDSDSLYVSCPSLLKDAGIGDRILLDDGLIQLVVRKKTGRALSAEVVEGGVIRDRKGVNLPGMNLSVKSFTEKDRKDLRFGLDQGVDYAAVSFVRTPSDISRIRKWMKLEGRSAPLIAKIEKPEALRNIDGILEEADGIMIARGDLGVEVSPEEVPLIQKELIEAANVRGKIVITATQMLESMKEHLRPTRAEASDVANAVMDGSDAVMLSAETASGRYPLEALMMMDKIIRFTEKTKAPESVYQRGGSYADALADAACRAADDINAKALVAFTQSGFTARLLSKLRPKAPIIAFTPEKAVLSRLPFLWGVIPRLIRKVESTEALLREVEKNLLEEGLVKKGDRIVVTASSPLPAKGKTNFMKLHAVGGLL